MTFYCPVSLADPAFFGNREEGWAEAKDLFFKFSLTNLSINWILSGWAVSKWFLNSLEIAPVEDHSGIDNKQPQTPHSNRVSVMFWGVKQSTITCSLRGTRSPFGNNQCPSQQLRLKKYADTVNKIRGWHS